MAKISTLFEDSTSKEKPSLPMRILTLCLSLPAAGLLLICLPFLVVSAFGCWAAWSCISLISGNGSLGLSVALKNAHEFPFGT